MTFGSLFAGIGGMDLGLERAGMECKWQVEIDPFCQKVLAKHWSHVKRYGDIRAVTELERVDLIAGGFPCQDISYAGLGVGIDGKRSGLWSEMLRVIRLVRPNFVLVENVSALLTRGIDRVLGGLAESGYDAEWQCIPAASFGAPHIRDRIWILAYSRQKPWRNERRDHDRCGCSYVFPQASNWKAPERGYDWEFAPLVPGIHQRSSADWWISQSKVARSVNGIPRKLVDAANGGFGNAVVPQAAEWIGRRILDAAQTQS